MIYCLGFAFDQTQRRVLLIEKNHPQWQAGKYNGLGGKVEKDESGDDAMVREFREEFGRVIEKWNCCCELLRDGWKVYVYYAFSDEVYKIQRPANNREVTRLFPLAVLPLNIIHNVPWLIQLALSYEREQLKVPYLIQGGTK